MQSAGLGGDVTITRDPNGRPHIKAKTRARLFAGGLGLCALLRTALWAMEVSRMGRQGRLSGNFGSATVDVPISARTWAFIEGRPAAFDGVHGAETKGNA